MTDQPLNLMTATESEQQEFDLRQYLDLLLRHWKLVAACIGTACGIGILHAYLAVPIYRAATLVSVERDKMSMADLGLSGGFVAMNDPDFLPTQQRIMRGRDVLESVVQRRQSAGRPGFAGKPETTAADAEAAIAAERQIKALADRLNVNIVRGTSLLEISFFATNAREAADLANSVAEAYIDWTKRSRAEQSIQVSQFLGAQIEQLKKDVEDKERRFAELGKAKEFLPLESGSGFYSQKLETFNKDYAAAVADRINKEARAQLVGAMKPEDIADQDPAVATARAEQQKLEREYSEKLSIWKPDFPAMKQLKARIERGQKYLEAAGREAAEKARDKARVELDAARKREEVLRGVLRSQTAETLGQNVSSLEFANARVEIQATRALLDTMLKKQAEVEVTSRLQDQRQPNIRVVERAVPPEFRSYPSYRNNLQIAFLAGLLLGVGLVFLIDRLDRSIRTQEQIEKLVQVPALGVIPAVGSSGRGYGLSLLRYGYGYGYGYGYLKAYRRRKKAEAGKGDSAPLSELEDPKTRIDLIPHERPRSQVSEAYRAFRALLLMSRAGGVRTMVITSALPGEGKTTTASNLAVTLAQLGKKVILIDADLHKPRVHEVFRVSNRSGIVSVLAEGAPIKDVLHQTAVPGLWVMTAGPMTPNPSGLLSSDGMRVFLDQLAERFDYIVFDSPPVQPVADALILGALTDGVILTVRGGITPRDAIIKARNRMRRGNVRILGALINNLRLGPAQKAGYGSYKGYDYGYGYGNAYGDRGRDEASAGKSEEQKKAPAA